MQSSILGRTVTPLLSNAPKPRNRKKMLSNCCNVGTQNIADKPMKIRLTWCWNPRILRTNLRISTISGVKFSG